MKSHTNFEWMVLNNKPAGAVDICIYSITPLNENEPVFILHFPFGTSVWNAPGINTSWNFNKMDGIISIVIYSWTPEMAIGRSENSWRGWPLYVMCLICNLVSVRYWFSLGLKVGEELGERDGTRDVLSWIVTLRLVRSSQGGQANTLTIHTATPDTRWPGLPGINT